MPKTHSFKELFQNWQKAKDHLVEVKLGEKNCEKGSHAFNYWQKYVKDAERAEKYWLEKMGDYGKGTLIQVTGLIKVGDAPEVDHGNGIIVRGAIPYSHFIIFLMNANTEEVKQYLTARFPNIEKGTIELMEFQTGILIV